jgi:branched-chain amino acid transport system substrate-binding protein
MKRDLFLKLFISTTLTTTVGFVTSSCTLFQGNEPTNAPQTINVGTILGLSGEGAVYGEKMKRGFEFAIETNNNLPSTTAKNKKFKLVIEDSQFSPAKAVSSYQKLTGVQGIKVLVGVTGSKNALQVCSIAKADNVVIIDALSTAPKISSECGSNYFRVIASDALAGKYNVDWALESGMKKPVIVYIEDDWGTSYRDSTLKYLTQKGFTNIPVYGIKEGDRDFRTQIEKIKGVSPDTVFLLIYAKSGSGFMQQLRQADVKATAYGSDNLSSPEFAAAGSEVVEGVKVALPAPSQGASLDDFTKQYKAKYGEEPDAVLIKSYDAMGVTITAIDKVGNDAVKIRDYLKSPDFQYQGISGVIKFDEKGDLVSQQYSRQVYKGGKLLPLK